MSDYSERISAARDKATLAKVARQENKWKDYYALSLRAAMAAKEIATKASIEFGVEALNPFDSSSETLLHRHFEAARVANDGSYLNIEASADSIKETKLLHQLWLNPLTEGVSGKTIEQLTQSLSRRTTPTEQRPNKQ